MKLPARSEVRAKLVALVGENLSREQAAEWARPFIGQAEPQVEDQVTWRIVTKIGAAATPTTDRPYLYGKEDFMAWLAELDQA